MTEQQITAADFPPVRTQTIPLALVEDHPDNPRLHPDSQKEALSASLETYTYVRLAVVQALEGGRFRWVAGHGVGNAAKAEGYAELEVRVIPAEWPDWLVQEYMVADNGTAALGQDDSARLAAILERAIERKREVLAMGYDRGRLAGVLAETRHRGGYAGIKGTAEGADTARALAEEWSVVPGQVWKLGEHRLICGDAADPGAWERLAAQREGGVEGIFTSPPYAQQRKGSYGGIAEADYLHWFEPAQANARTHLAAGGSFFLNIKAHSEDGRRSLYVLDLVLAMARRWGWSFIDEFCWTRQGLPGRWPNRFKNAFEPIFHFARSPDIRFFPEAVIRPFSPATIIGSRHYVGRNTDHSYHISNNVTAAGLDGALPSNVLTIPTGQTAETIGAYHGAAFPPALAEFFIKAFSQPGDTWCDPFLGSGTTLIACETLGRRCVGIEIRPEYVAVALARWQHKTGRLPRLIAN